MSLLLVLVLAPRGFFPASPVFPSPQKPLSKFQLDLDYCQALTDERPALEIAQALHVLLTLNKLLYFKRIIAIPTQVMCSPSLRSCSLNRTTRPNSLLTQLLE